MKISGTIRSTHPGADYIAGALSVDNLRSMQTSAENGTVICEVRGTKLRSITASVDDYLMNLAIAEEICTYISSKEGQVHRDIQEISLKDL